MANSGEQDPSFSADVTEKVAKGWLDFEAMEKEAEEGRKVKINVTPSGMTPETKSAAPEAPATQPQPAVSPEEFAALQAQLAAIQKQLEALQVSGPRGNEPYQINLSMSEPPRIEPEAPAPQTQTEIPPAAKPSIDPERASVPFMITRDQKQQLADLGYSLNQIKNLKPEEAHRILSSNNRPSEKASVPESTPPSDEKKPERTPEQIEQDKKEYRKFQQNTRREVLASEVLAGEMQSATASTPEASISATQPIIIEPHVGIPHDFRATYEMRPVPGTMSVSVGETVPIAPTTPATSSESEVVLTPNTEAKVEEDVTAAVLGGSTVVRETAQPAPTTQATDVSTPLTLQGAATGTVVTPITVDAISSSVAPLAPHMPGTPPVVEPFSLEDYNKHPELLKGKPFVNVNIDGAPMAQFSITNVESGGEVPNIKYRQAGAPYDNSIPIEQFLKFLRVGTFQLGEVAASSLPPIAPASEPTPATPAPEAPQPTVQTPETTPYNPLEQYQQNPELLQGSRVGDDTETFLVEVRKPLPAFGSAWRIKLTKEGQTAATVEYPLDAFLSLLRSGKLVFKPDTVRTPEPSAKTRIEADIKEMGEAKRTARELNLAPRNKRFGFKRSALTSWFGGKANVPEPYQETLSPTGYIAENRPIEERMREPLARMEALRQKIKERPQARAERKNRFSSYINRLVLAAVFSAIPLNQAPEIKPDNIAGAAYTTGGAVANRAQEAQSSTDTALSPTPDLVSPAAPSFAEQMAAPSTPAEAAQAQSALQAERNATVFNFAPTLDVAANQTAWRQSKEVAKGITADSFEQSFLGDYIEKRIQTHYPNQDLNKIQPQSFDIGFMNSPEEQQGLAKARETYAAMTDAQKAAMMRQALTR